jgi:hypothetical protein
MSAVRLAAVAALTAALALGGLVILRPGRSRPDAPSEDVRRAAEELRVATARVAEAERRKKDLEAQVGELERLTAGSAARLLTSLDATSRALGVEIREINLNGGRLSVTLRAPSLGVARRLGVRLQEQHLVTDPVVVAASKTTFSLRATVAGRS